jgi:chorismate mutase/prephenate dehydratase
MIGFLGPENSYTYVAASSFYVRDQLIAYNNIGRLFYALENDEVEGIVVPYENMKDGTSFDMLNRVSKNNYHISRVIDLDIVLQLASKEYTINGLEQVYLTNHSLNECYNTLKKELGKYQKFEVKSNRIAASKLDLESTIKKGAVVSIYDELDDYNIVLNNIRDTKENLHKYIFVTKPLKVNGFHNRTIIVTAPKKNKIGALYDILHEIVLRQLNITKILSNPIMHKEDNIEFYIEFEGNIEDKIVIEALGMIKVKSSFTKIVGSYYQKEEKESTSK